MDTAITAYTPNTPWAKLGCSDIVDHDGGGTSAATPQVAAAAAIWIATNWTTWNSYPQDWTRVEAIRAALFESTQTNDKTHFGRGPIKAAAATEIKPAAASLTDGQRILRAVRAAAAIHGPVYIRLGFLTPIDGYDATFRIGEAVTMRDGTVSVRDQLSRSKAKETQYEHINAALSGVSPDTATSFLIDVQIPGTGKRTLRAKGELAASGSSHTTKTSLNGRVEFSDVPLADLKLLILPSDETGLPWEGKLTTQTQVQGDLFGALHLEGVTRFTGLKSTNSGQENPEVSGDLAYKLAYEVSSGLIRFESAKLQLPNSRVDLSGSIKPAGDNTLVDLEIESQKSSLDDLLKLASVFGSGPPKGVEAKGDGSFHLQVAGSTAKPEVNGQCNFTNFRLRYPGVKEEIVVSPVTINFKSPGFISNEVLISVGERTRLNTQFTGSLGAEKFLSANLKSQNSFPVADLNAIGSSFGATLASRDRFAGQ
jgi:hypothetical protein